VDVDPVSFCLDLDLAEAAITHRTKAIMVVSLNGRAPDMERAVGIASRHGLAVLEDAAQALGAHWRGRHLGTFGAIGSFSFSAPKIITTGQGGALVTDDDELAKAIRGIRDFGRPRAGADLHERLGYNFKFTDLQAVIGVAQMKKLDFRVRRKKQIYSLYQDLLRSVEQVDFPPTDLHEVPPWFVDVLVPGPAELLQHLRARDIGSRRFYPPIHTQAPYRQVGSFPRAERIAAHGLWLPSSSFLDDDTIACICGEIRAFYTA
jgi:perosamine synthetase